MSDHLHAGSRRLVGTTHSAGHIGRFRGTFDGALADDAFSVDRTPEIVAMRCDDSRVHILTRDEGSFADGTTSDDAVWGAHPSSWREGMVIYGTDIWHCASLAAAAEMASASSDIEAVRRGLPFYREITGVVPATEAREDSAVHALLKDWQDGRFSDAAARHRVWSFETVDVHLGRLFKSMRYNVEQVKRATHTGEESSRGAATSARGSDGASARSSDGASARGSDGASARDAKVGHASVPLDPASERNRTEASERSGRELGVFDVSKSFSSYTSLGFSARLFKYNAYSATVSCDSCFLTLDVRIQAWGDIGISYTRGYINRLGGSVTIYPYVRLGLKFTVDWSKTWISESYTKSLADVKLFTTTFFIGPVPVLLDFLGEIVVSFTYSTALSGGVKDVGIESISGYARATYDYRGRSGMTYKYEKPSYRWLTPVPVLVASATASLEFAIGINAQWYKVWAWKFWLVPYLQISLSKSYGDGCPSLSVKAALTWGLKGRFDLKEPYIGYGPFSLYIDAPNLPLTYDFDIVPSQTLWTRCISVRINWGFRRRLALSSSAAADASSHLNPLLMLADGGSMATCAAGSAATRLLGSLPTATAASRPLRLPQSELAGGAAPRMLTASAFIPRGGVPAACWRSLSELQLLARSAAYARSAAAPGVPARSALQVPAAGVRSALAAAAAAGSPCLRALAAAGYGAGFSNSADGALRRLSAERQQLPPSFLSSSELPAGWDAYFVEHEPAQPFAGSAPADSDHQWHHERILAADAAPSSIVVEDDATIALRSAAALAAVSDTGASGSSNDGLPTSHPSSDAGLLLRQAVLASADSGDASVCAQAGACYFSVSPWSRPDAVCGPVVRSRSVSCRHKITALPLPLFMCESALGAAPDTVDAAGQGWTPCGVYQEFDTQEACIGAGSGVMSSVSVTSAQAFRLGADSIVTVTCAGVLGDGRAAGNHTVNCSGADGSCAFEQLSMLPSRAAACVWSPYSLRSRVPAASPAFGGAYSRIDCHAPYTVSSNGQPAAPLPLPVAARHRALLSATAPTLLRWVATVPPSVDSLTLLLTVQHAWPASQGMLPLNFSASFYPGLLSGAEVTWVAMPAEVPFESRTTATVAMPLLSALRLRLSAGVAGFTAGTPLILTLAASPALAAASPVGAALIDLIAVPHSALRGASAITRILAPLEAVQTADAAAGKLRVVTETHPAIGSVSPASFKTAALFSYSRSVADDGVIFTATALDPAAVAAGFRFSLLAREVLPQHLPTWPGSGDAFRADTLASSATWWLRDGDPAVAPVATQALSIKDDEYLGAAEFAVSVLPLTLPSAADSSAVEASTAVVVRAVPVRRLDPLRAETVRLSTGAQAAFVLNAPPRCTRLVFRVELGGGTGAALSGTGLDGVRLLAAPGDFSTAVTNAVDRPGLDGALVLTLTPASASWSPIVTIIVDAAGAGLATGAAVGSAAGASVLAAMGAGGSDAELIVSAAAYEEVDGVFPQTFSLLPTTSSIFLSHPPAVTRLPSSAASPPVGPAAARDAEASFAALLRDVSVVLESPSNAAPSSLSAFAGSAEALFPAPSAGRAAASILGLGSSSTAHIYRPFGPDAAGGLLPDLAVSVQASFSQLASLNVSDAAVAAAVEDSGLPRGLAWPSISMLGSGSGSERRLSGPYDARSTASAWLPGAPNARRPSVRRRMQLNNLAGESWVSESGGISAADLLGLSLPFAAAAATSTGAASDLNAAATALQTEILAAVSASAYDADAAAFVQIPLSRCSSVSATAPSLCASLASASRHVVAVSIPPSSVLLLSASFTMPSVAAGAVDQPAATDGSVAGGVRPGTAFAWSAANPSLARARLFFITAQPAAAALSAALPLQLVVRTDTAAAVPATYSWSASAWSACSAVCATGEQTRVVFCSDAATGQAVPDASQCARSGPRPAGSRPCSAGACVPTAGAWSDCNARCGGGLAFRSVACRNGDGVGAVVPMFHCGSVAAAVATVKQCNQAPCPNATGGFRWHAAAFGPCSAPCGGGQRIRSVRCVAASTGTPAPVAACFRSTDEPPPAAAESCNASPCAPTQARLAIADIMRLTHAAPPIRADSEATAAAAAAAAVPAGAVEVMLPATGAVAFRADRPAAPSDPSVASLCLRARIVAAAPVATQTRLHALANACRLSLQSCVANAAAAAVNTATQLRPSFALSPPATAVEAMAQSHSAVAEAATGLDALVATKPLLQTAADALASAVAACHANATTCTLYSAFSAGARLGSAPLSLPLAIVTSDAAYSAGAAGDSESFFSQLASAFSSDCVRATAAASASFSGTTGATAAAAASSLCSVTIASASQRVIADLQASEATLSAGGDGLVNVTLGLFASPLGTAEAPLSGASMPHSPDTAVFSAAMPNSARARSGLAPLDTLFMHLRDRSGGGAIPLDGVLFSVVNGGGRGARVHVSATWLPSPAVSLSGSLLGPHSDAEIRAGGLTLTASLACDAFVAGLAVEAPGTGENGTAIAALLPAGALLSGLRASPSAEAGAAAGDSQSGWNAAALPALITAASTPGSPVLAFSADRSSVTLTLPPLPGYAPSAEERLSLRFPAFALSSQRELLAQLPTGTHFASITAGNADCAVSQWGPWSNCPAVCQDRSDSSAIPISVRSRTVTQPRRGTGLPCPGLTDSRSCADPCNPCAGLQCANGGVCVLGSAPSQATPTRCVCPPGFSGQDCSLPPTTAAASDGGEGAAAGAGSAPLLPVAWVAGLWDPCVSHSAASPSAFAGVTALIASSRPVTCVPVACLVAASALMKASSQVQRDGSTAAALPAACTARPGVTSATCEAAGLRRPASARNCSLAPPGAPASRRERVVTFSLTLKGSSAAALQLHSEAAFAAADALAATLARVLAVPVGSISIASQTPGTQAVTATALLPLQLEVRWMLPSLAANGSSSAAAAASAPPPDPAALLRRLANALAQLRASFAATAPIRAGSAASRRLLPADAVLAALADVDLDTLIEYAVATLSLEPSPANSSHDAALAVTGVTVDLASAQNAAPASLLELATVSLGDAGGSGGSAGGSGVAVGVLAGAGAVVAVSGLAVAVLAWKTFSVRSARRRHARPAPLQTSESGASVGVSSSATLRATAGPVGMMGNPMLPSPTAGTGRGLPAAVPSRRPAPLPRASELGLGLDLASDASEQRIAARVMTSGARPSGKAVALAAQEAQAHHALPARGGGSRADSALADGSDATALARATHASVDSAALRGAGV